ncbi:MAG: DNA polymerase I [Endomicrobiales bacterium]|nr:DNA polymerase I [Endomicrobiales bacterium]
MKKLYLIDGNSYIHRAYHALPPLTTSKGEMVNAVYGFIRMMLKILNSEKPDYVAVCFDYPAKTFRHKEYPEYKATRKKIDEELKNQMPLARDAARALNLEVFEKEGYEADDIIATLAKDAEKDKVNVVIVTGDKDAYQLVDNNISILNEQKSIIYTPQKVEEKYGLKPEKMIDMFSLMGDSSDNVPGVRGIGEKTAVKLLQKFGSLENIFKNINSIEGRTKELLSGAKNDAEKSKSLVTLNSKVPLGKKWSDCEVKSIDENKAIEFFKRFEFTSLIRDISSDKTSINQAQAQGVPVKFEVNLIESAEDLKKLIKSLKKTDKLSVDLETNNLNPLNSKIVGISLSYDSKGGFYIPVGHNYLNVPKQLAIKEVIKELKPIFEDKDIKKYGHNIKFDLLVLKNNDVTLQGIHFDTMIASYCLNPARSSHGLKNVTFEYLGYRMTEIKELIGTGAKQITMDKVEINRVAPYACADAVMVIRLAEGMEKELKEKNLEELFFDVEMPLVNILSEMESAGIKIDEKYLKHLSQEFLSSLSKLQRKIFTLAEEEFNINSPKQLAFILFEKLKLPVIKKTKTGSSTDEEVLRTLSSQHDLPKYLLEYRELQKLKSTYIDALLDLLDFKENRIHTSFNQTVTATGRLSSSNPNLQNIPIRTEYGKKIRRGFIAEKGFLFLSADYSQIDLRALAHISEDKALINAFNKGEDIHTATAKEVFGKVDADLRRVAKTINFGIVYGQSPYGLAQQLGISNSQAKEYIDHYFSKYSGVKVWKEKIIKQAQKDGYVSTLLGRIRYLPEINAKNAQVRGFAERMALNTPIQGTSADIIKVAMINVDKEIRKNHDETRLLLQVHDELLFEVPEKEIRNIARIVKSLMENSVQLKVPVVVDVKAGKNWMDMEQVTV